MTREEIIENKSDLVGKDMRSANMSFANMRFANMRSANMRSANMRSANMRSANMSSANMSSADMSSADMSFANMSSADMSFANMSFADMRSADMRSADLEGSLLTHIDARFLQLNEDKEILFRMDCCGWAITIWHKVVHIGCKEFTFDEILNMDAEKAEAINEGAGKRWNRWGKTLKTAIQDIIDSGL